MNTETTQKSVEALLPARESERGACSPLIGYLATRLEDIANELDMIGRQYLLCEDGGGARDAGVSLLSCSRMVGLAAEIARNTGEALAAASPVTQQVIG